MYFLLAQLAELFV